MPRSLVSRLATALLSLAVACLVVGAASAQGQLNGRGVLWRIDGGPAPSYLFGTIHVTDERVLRLPAEFFEAFDACEEYLFELVIPPDGGLWSIIPSMSLPNNVQLRDVVGREAFDKLVTHATRYGISTDELTRIHPWALTSIFGKPPNEWMRSRQGWAFLDQALQNEARAKGKPVHALETMDEQMAPDAILDKVDMAASLITMLDNSFQADAEFETLVRDYLDRNMAAVFAREQSAMSMVSGRERQILEQYNRQMLDIRNRRMAKRAESYLRKGKAFVAVGAGHLPGEKGLVQLIRNRGFEVTRVY